MLFPADWLSVSTWQMSLDVQDEAVDNKEDAISQTAGNFTERTPWQIPARKFDYTWMKWYLSKSFTPWDGGRTQSIIPFHVFEATREMATLADSKTVLHLSSIPFVVLHVRGFVFWRISLWIKLLAASDKFRRVLSRLHCGRRGRGFQCGSLCCMRAGTT